MQRRIVYSIAVYRMGNSVGEASTMTMLGEKQRSMNARLTVVGLIALAVFAGCSFGGGDRPVTDIEGSPRQSGNDPGTGPERRQSTAP